MIFEAKLCPFCKKDNNCNVLKANLCWCMKIEVPDELKSLVPAKSKMKSCICKTCIEEFKKDSKSFKNKHSFLSISK